MLSDSFRPERLARALSLFAYSALVGISVGFFAGGWVLHAVAKAGDTIVIAGYEMAPWRLVFILAALPGVLLALMIAVLREPPRQGLLDSGEATTARDTFAYIWAHRGSYFPYYGAVVLFAIVMYGGMTWFPTHMMRNLSLTPGGAGFTLGVVHLIAGAVGALGGPFVLARFVRTDSGSAHMRTLLVVALGCAAPAIFAPLVSNAGIAVFLWLVAQMFLGAYYGIALAALQIITPNRMRGLNTAFFSFCITLVGLGVGSACVGALTDVVFADDHAVGKSLALVNAVAITVATVILLRGLRSIRARAA
jgi:MFS family permease